MNLLYPSDFAKEISAPPAHTYHISVDETHARIVKCRNSIESSHPPVKSANRHAGEQLVQIDVTGIKTIRLGDTWTIRGNRPRDQDYLAIATRQNT